MRADGHPPGPPSYEILHERARMLLKAGSLPRTDAYRIYGGYGSDRGCELCAMPITPKEVEYELEFAATAASPASKLLVYFHLACHAIWDYERQHFE